MLKNKSLLFNVRLYADKNKSLPFFYIRFYGDICCSVVNRVVASGRNECLGPGAVSLPMESLSIQVSSEQFSMSFHEEKKNQNTLISLKTQNPFSIEQHMFTTVRKLS